MPYAFPHAMLTSDVLNQPHSCPSSLTPAFPLSNPKYHGFSYLLTLYCSLIASDMVLPLSVTGQTLYFILHYAVCYLLWLYKAKLKAKARTNYGSHTFR